MLKFIADKAHYAEVIALVPKVKHSLWIGTADIKDLYVKVGSQTKPFLAVLAELIKKGVEVRLIHAKEQAPRSVKTSTNTLTCLKAWRGYFVRGCISRSWSSTVKWHILAAQTLPAQASE